MHLFNAEGGSLQKKVKTLMQSIGKKYNALSIKNGVEYGGYVYSSGGKLVQSELFTGKGGEVEILYPGNRNIIASWHTHGSNSASANLFSRPDIDIANQLDAAQANYQGSYLFTPNNHMYYYEGGDVSNTFI